jgi:predicted phosphodiesterase
MANKILCVPDIHFPFENKKVVNKIIEAIKLQQPTHVVQMGDLIDQYSFSRYDKNLELTSPRQEIGKARNLAEEFWMKVQKAAPKAKCYQLLGNHDVRLSKRIADKVPEANYIIAGYIKELYSFPNVTTMNSTKDILQLGDVKFIHGYLSKLGDHMAYFSGKVVVGHSHVGGAVFKQLNHKTIWELNSGYAANEKALPLQYGETSRKKWTTGYGLIDSDGPRFIPIAK